MIQPFVANARDRIVRVSLGSPERRRAICGRCLRRRGSIGIRRLRRRCTRRLSKPNARRKQGDAQGKPQAFRGELTHRLIWS